MIEFECSCAMKRHSAPLKGCEISCGAIHKIPEILSQYERIYTVSDERTYRAAGERVEEILKSCGKHFSSCILKGETVLPNAESLGNVLLYAHDISAKADIFASSPMPDFILAIGSGTVNDVCRLAAYRLGIPYGICGTAPSMDGYASAGTPFLHDGTKSTVQGTTPRYIIADLDVMRQAPYEMMLAGIGDMFGKYTGILDWELARDYTGEYFCEKIARDVLDATNSCLHSGYRLAEREAAAVESVMRGFLVTGLGMAYTGNSRPASGSEHIIAHAWELFDVESKNPPHLHGLEVCEATRLVAILYRMLLAESDDTHLKELIEKYIPYFDAVEDFCIKMKMPPTVTDRETIIRGIRRALVMRDRYTVLFYLRDRGLFDDYIERATDKLLEIL